MSNSSGFEQAVPQRSHIAASLPDAGEIVWSDANVNADMWLQESWVLRESRAEWGTPTYGQLAVDLVEFERDMLAKLSLIGELDKTGRVMNSGWNHWRLSGESTDEPLSFEEAVGRAAVALQQQNFLLPTQLRVGNLSVRGSRTKLLNVVPQPSTYESARRGIEAKDAHPLHGAFGKAYDLLAMAIGMREMPLEHNFNFFVPDTVGWVSQKDLVCLAQGTGMGAQKIKTMQTKIRQLLGEQVETGVPVPTGEIVVEGACALDVDCRTGLPKVSYEYISCDSFPSVFAEYGSALYGGRADTRAFFERLAGRPIALDGTDEMSGVKRRRSRAVFNLDQTIPE